MDERLGYGTNNAAKLVIHGKIHKVYLARALICLLLRRRRRIRFLAHLALILQTCYDSMLSSRSSRHDRIVHLPTSFIERNCE